MTTVPSSMMTMPAPKLCNYNIRLGGFGPVAPGTMHLTTCFLDVILVPLPTWILLVVLLPILFVSRRFSPVHSVAPTTRPSRLIRILGWVYHVLIIAAIAMLVLEITRLALSHQGVGLLPFTLAGLLIALAISWGRRKNWRSVNSVAGVLLTYWVMLTAVQAAKVSTLADQEMAFGGKSGPSKYLFSDQLLDSAVILGLYVVFIFSEIVYLIRAARLKKSGGVVNHDGPLLRDGGSDTTRTGNTMAEKV